MTRAITKKRNDGAMTSGALRVSAERAIDRILRASFWSPRAPEPSAHHAHSATVIALPRVSSSR